MCFDGKLSPVTTMTSSKNEVGTPSPKKVVVRYQNVSLASMAAPTSDAAAETESLFHLQDKKAEVAAPKRSLIKEDMASLVLSGGCVIDLSENESRSRPPPQPQPPPMIVHHHHHHFYPVPPSSSSTWLAHLDILDPRQQNSSMTDNNNQRLYQRPSVVNGNLSNIHRVLSLNKQMLEQSSFYYGPINWSQSTELLSKTSEGTFLVRDSADSRFLFSLSVQRKPEDGPTSVRIHFSFGKFRLDADEAIEHLMPTFDSVLDLVKHYCQLTDNGDSDKGRAKSHVWIDNTGQLYTPICLRKPLLKEVPTLAHWARLAIHQSPKFQDKMQELHLPRGITTYLSDYPHVV